MIVGSSVFTAIQNSQFRFLDMCSFHDLKSLAAVVLVGNNNIILHPSRNISHKTQILPIVNISRCINLDCFL